MRIAGPAVGSATGSATRRPLGGLGSTGDGGGGAPSERIVDTEFLTGESWDTSGAAWTIALGTALNNTAGQFIICALNSPVLSGQEATATVVVNDNPNGVSWMIALYNTSTLASQNVFSEGGGAPGTFSNETPVMASADYDAVRIRAIGDAGLLLDSVSLVA